MRELCVLFTEPQHQIQARGRSRDCSHSRTGFSALLRKLQKTLPLPTLEAQSVTEGQSCLTFPGCLITTTLLRVEITLIVLLFFPLWMQLLCTCDLTQHQLGTKHCADSPGLFQQQGPASANFLCQLGNERSQIPLFQISTVSRRAVGRAHTR